MCGVGAREKGDIGSSIYERRDIYISIRWVSAQDEWLESRPIPECSGRSYIDYPALPASAL